MPLSLTRPPSPEPVLCVTRWNTDRHSPAPMWLGGGATNAQALIFGVVEKKTGRFGDRFIGKCWGVCIRA